MSTKEKSGNDLQSLAKSIAQWADRRPAVEKAYVFGSYARGDAGPDSDLDLAIKFTELLTNEATEDWTQQSCSGMAELKAAIGEIPLSLHKQSNDAAWPAIHEAAKHPVLVVRKVVCCATPPMTCGRDKIAHPTSRRHVDPRHDILRRSRRDTFAL